VKISTHYLLLLQAIFMTLWKKQQHDTLAHPVPLNKPHQWPLTR